MISKTLISVLVFSAAFVFIFVCGFIYLRSADKDTCKFIIQETLVFAINQKRVRLEIPLDSNWKEFDSIQRKQLLDFAKENVSRDTECSNYSYLIKGEETDGTELPILARKDNSDRIEIQLGK